MNVFSSVLPLIARQRAPRRRGRLLAVGLLAGGMVCGGVAVAAVQQPAIRTFTPQSDREVTNIDLVRQQIRNYYGDPLSTGIASPASPYARQASGIAAGAARFLAQPYRGTGTKAIVLDVDDTTLRTYNYEIASNFAFNPMTNGQFVTGQLFEPVFGMPATVASAAKEGYAIFYLTGRGAAQEPATLGNLTVDGVGVDAGYPAPTTLSDGEDGLFTKPAVADYPAYLQTACAGDPNGSCTTRHYKTATRAHIESLGYDIVANFGDQFSDLSGGHADRTFKLPNPTYYLP